MARKKRHTQGADTHEVTEDQNVKPKRGKRPRKAASRRQFLSVAAGAGVLVPMTLLWGSTGQGKAAGAAAAAGTALSVDVAQWDAVGAQIVGQVATDPTFRAAVEADPVGTLQQMGVTLPPEVEQALLQQPESLTKAMLGEEFPPLPSGAPAEAQVLAVVPIVVVIYCVVIVIAAKAEAQVPATKYASALGMALTGKEVIGVGGQTEIEVLGQPEERRAQSDRGSGPSKRAVAAGSAGAAAGAAALTAAAIYAKRHLDRTSRTPRPRE